MILFVVTTLPDESTAAQIVHRLVEKKLAACGTIIPGARSIYRWKDKDANFAAALLASLTGVLTAAMQAAGGEPVAGTKSVTLHVSATFDGAQWIDAPITLASLTDDELNLARNVLTAVLGAEAR